MITHLKRPTAELVKRNIKPLEYFMKRIGGRLGRPSRDGWHQWNGLCPFHQDKRPGTFFINVNSGAFKCFSCGAKGGDVIACEQLLHDCTFPQALEKLGGLK